tara:strand:- start:1247 stop:2083 length:837 start_codon:yes stop_codon:yes gene_type:complete
VTLKSLKDSFIQGLKQNYSSSEAEQLFYMAIDHLWTLSRTDYLRDSGKEWEKDTSGLHRIVLRLLQHEPIQYIIGETLFYGLRIKLNRHTLIPRPETEELMERIKNSDLQPETILDAGSGSGCIALALKRIFPAAHCTGVDISEGALQLARQNAVLNGLEVSFRQMDILKSENLQQSFDLIVSNPPYVAEAEKENMSAGVTDHEPYTALFVPDADPLVFYRMIEKIADKKLNPGGRIFLEINQRFGPETAALFSSGPWQQVILHQDLSGNDRFLEVWK